MFNAESDLNKLVEKYRGLRKEDLDLLNPSYSCVICANISCEIHNQPQRCCEHHVVVEESEWARFYNFE